MWGKWEILRVGGKIGQGGGSKFENGKIRGKEEIGLNGKFVRIYFKKFLKT
jgi:hypothetical protein